MRIDEYFIQEDNFILVTLNHNMDEVTVTLQIDGDHLDTDEGQFLADRRVDLLRRTRECLFEAMLAVEAKIQDKITKKT